MRKLKLHELKRDSTEEFKNKEKYPVEIILDNIRSAHNVGSVFRTSDAFAISHVYLCGITARPPHKEIHKTAIGATESVEWTYHENIEELVKSLKSESKSMIGVEQTSTSSSLMDFNFSGLKKPIVLVFGNEVQGLSERILPLLDMALEIPQYGTKHSFNISVCAGIVLWECIRQMKV